LVDGEPFYITGRIDRIDLHPETNLRQILDFKTSEKGDGPEKTHRAGAKNQREWIDLQLPLYRHLAASRGIGGKMELAYVVLPESAGVELLAADWTPAELNEAEEKAREVIRAIRASIFWPPAQIKPPLFEEYADLCLDAHLAGWAFEEDDEEESA